MPGPAARDNPVIDPADVTLSRRRHRRFQVFISPQPHHPDADRARAFIAELQKFVP